MDIFKRKAKNPGNDSTKFRSLNIIQTVEISDLTVFTKKDVTWVL